jgi:hypothetical protein
VVAGVVTEPAPQVKLPSATWALMAAVSGRLGSGWCLTARRLVYKVIGHFQERPHQPEMIQAHDTSKEEQSCFISGSRTVAFDDVLLLLQRAGPC